ncbi:50S ribosomal protein L16 [Microgenomates group bacterium RIFCSPLOWO2_01_FULL_47_10]|nr:ribosomal protein L16 [uncultured bacterium]OGV92393.1 MAG: 50S ribosomal protein L16 [Microgenomates group bacterium RIFCSPLOWO2_01_FULL_47_10]
MLQPKKRKYRKEFRGKRRGIAMRGNAIDFGEFGLKVEGNGWITARQIEAARKTIQHHTKRQGKLFIRVFPDKPVTHKAAGSKMGSGKGDIEQYVAVVKMGKVLFELSGLPIMEAKEAFRKAGHKLPLKTHFISKDQEL